MQRAWRARGDKHRTKRPLSVAKISKKVDRPKARRQRRLRRARRRRVALEESAAHDGALSEMRNGWRVRQTPPTLLSLSRMRALMVSRIQLSELAAVRSAVSWRMRNLAQSPVPLDLRIRGKLAFFAQF